MSEKVLNNKMNFVLNKNSDIKTIFKIIEISIDSLPDELTADDSAYFQH